MAGTLIWICLVGDLVADCTTEFITMIPPTIWDHVFWNLFPFASKSRKSKLYTQVFFPQKEELRIQGCRFEPKKHVRHRSPPRNGTENGYTVNISDSRVWGLDSGPNLQPWNHSRLFFFS